MATRVELRVLSAAYEEVPLWELTADIRNYGADGVVRIEPSFPRDQIAGALAAALSRGDVTLYSRSDPDKKDLPLDEALEIVGNPTYWSVGEAPTVICVFLTDRGMDRMKQEGR